MFGLYLFDGHVETGVEAACQNAAPTVSCNGMDTSARPGAPAFTLQRSLQPEAPAATS